MSARRPPNLPMVVAVFCAVWAAGGAPGLFGALPPAAEAADKPRHHDIYLTGERVCKACVGRWLDRQTIELANRQGERTIVPASEIIGVDVHPLARRIFRKSLHETGLAAKVIVPYAFDDWDEFVCKYCRDYDDQGSSE